ncbi:hypothetical protein [Parabacteroides merdae]|jgi:hypothetical protein|uniref:hypothetical protein n=1 Tax=Parabacteroides merdae TaxID=46503 RepID=UPI0034A3C4FA
MDTAIRNLITKALNLILQKSFSDRLLLRHIKVSFVNDENETERLVCFAIQQKDGQLIAVCETCDSSGISYGYKDIPLKDMPLDFILCLLDYIK